MAFYQQRLSTGWTFRDRDSEQSDLDAWMSVPTIPSTVQQDLIANNKLNTDFHASQVRRQLTFAI